MPVIVTQTGDYYNTESITGQTNLRLVYLAESSKIGCEERI